MSACHVSSKSRGRVKIGSVSHELIQLCLQHYNIPVRERNYIKSLYSQLNGKIATKNWVSDLFEFLKDIFQGDPYSPTIFLVIFQPLIDYIQLHRETHGYQLGKAKVLTTPFADDFDRLGICQDRRDRRSCKIFPNCVKFWGNNANSLGNSS